MGHCPQWLFDLSKICSIFKKKLKGKKRLHFINTIMYYFVSTILFYRETLLKGKAQYSWLPCTNLFRLVFIIYFLTKQATLKRRSTVQSLPLQLGFPDILYNIIFFKLFQKLWPWKLKLLQERLVSQNKSLLLLKFLFELICNYSYLQVTHKQVIKSYIKKAKLQVSLGYIMSFFHN